VGESQCPTCGHVTTGFETQEFEAAQASLAAKDAEIERLLAAITITLKENGHLADSDECTLIHLKRAVEKTA